MICKSTKNKDFIYLTNDEEIKENDWYYDSNGDMILKNYVNSYEHHWEKIIATNNPSLDVLQIPDEFVIVCEENDEVTLHTHTFEGEQHLFIIPYSVYDD